MAGKALVPLLPTSQVIPYCHNILTKISLKTTSQNNLHGVLAQIHYLLKAHLTSSSLFELKKDSITRITPLLKEKMALGTSMNHCNITRIMFLKIVQHMILTEEWTFGVNPSKQNELKQLLSLDIPLQKEVVTFCFKDLFEVEFLILLSYFFMILFSY